MEKGHLKQDVPRQKLKANKNKQTPRSFKGTMLKVSQLESIRELWGDGKCCNEIAKALSIDHKTVKKYVEMGDFSPKPYVPVLRGSKLDLYKPEIDRMLQEEKSWFHKQRHTAKRIREILIASHPEDKEVFSYSLVQRYVGEQRRWMKRENPFQKVFLQYCIKKKSDVLKFVFSLSKQ